MCSSDLLIIWARDNVWQNIDALWIRKAGGLICGDVYIIQGQSNAEATGPNNGPAEDEPVAGDEWIRSYGNQYDGTGRGAWGQAVRTHIWGRPDYGNHQIGAWGMVLARRLVETYKIPILPAR